MKPPTTPPYARCPGARPAAPRAAAGMSLIEALFASAILLVIAAGLLPLFIRSCFNNISGSDASQASQHA